MMDEEKEIRFVDLFAGIGGFHLGLEETSQEGVDRRQISLAEPSQSDSISKESRQEPSMWSYPRYSTCSFRCVWANEWDKYAASVYRKRFPETQLSTDDIRKVNADDIPDHDLLCAGFPCQAFSVAGKRRGFEETRGTLFFEIARIAERKRPRLLLLENVKGLLSHDEGRTFWTILRILGELGYFCEWQVLNSKWFGVPQNRERVFIVGHLGEEPTRTVFPIIGNDEKASQELRKIGNIAETGHDSLWGRVYDPEGIAMNINAEGGGVGAKTGLYVIPVLTPDRLEKRQHGRRFKEAGEEMFTLTGQDIHGIAYPELANTVCDGWLMSTQHHSAPMNQYRIRRLTPVECERLQGFPDGWTEFGYAKGKIVATEPIYGWVEEELNEDDDELWEGEPVKVWKVIGEKPLEKPIMDAVRISDTQRYKCLGNAVTVNVIRFLGERIEEIR